MFVCCHGLREGAPSTSCHFLNVTAENSYCIIYSTQMKPEKVNEEIHIFWYAIYHQHAPLINCSWKCLGETRGVGGGWWREVLASHGLTLIWILLIVQLVRNSGEATIQSRAGGKVISALHRLMSHKNRLTGSLNDLQRSQPLVSDA